MNRMLQVALVLVAILGLIGGGLWLAVAPPAGQQPELVAVKVATPPVLDGEVDAVWSQAREVVVAVTGGANLPHGRTTVRLKALYSRDTVYFLMTWADPTQSLRRAPFQKLADGSWKKLADPNDKGSDNNLYYEDKMAFIWNINDSIKGFNANGCFVT